MEGWFNRRATKPFYCHNSLPATAFQLIFLVKFLVTLRGSPGDNGKVFFLILRFLFVFKSIALDRMMDELVGGWKSGLKDW